MLSEFDNRGQDAIAESLHAFNDARLFLCVRIVVHDSSRDSKDFGEFCCGHFFWTRVQWLQYRRKIFPVKYFFMIALKHDGIYPVKRIKDGEK